MFTTEGKLKLYKDEMLASMEGLGHFFTTRFGGISGAGGGLFNASFSRETPEESCKVRENVRIAAEAEGVSPDRFTSVRQVHGDRVVKVTEEIAGARFGKPGLIIDADAMITDIPGTPLFTTHGDCVPVYIYAPRKAVGMVHSGWRGCVAGISGKTVEAMVREFGVRPDELYCAIGPAICKSCFEIDTPVYETLKNAFPDSGLYSFDPLRNKYFADLPGIVFSTLKNAGVRPENISKGAPCTCCPDNRGVFFSYRGEKGRNEGLMGAAIWLRDRIDQ